MVPVLPLLSLLLLLVLQLVGDGEKNAIEGDLSGKTLDCGC